MAEPPAEVWGRQARSDWNAAGRVLVDSDESTYCQAIAKYQQTVEKAVKMVVAAFRDKGRLQFDTGGGHRVHEHIKRVLDAIRRLPSPKRHEEKVRSIRGLLERRQYGIDALCALAPKLPAKGDPLPRNTEYPYQETPTRWRAPADPGSFSRKEVGQYRALAADLLQSAEKTAFFVRHLP